jgi:flagellar hook protein FlgE
MMRSLFSGVSGLKNHQTAIDVTGNNVANVNTTGFKASNVVFQDIVSQTISNATAPSSGSGGINSKQIGLGMSVSAITKDMTEGSTQSTDRPMDFAIQGEGYFTILQDGTIGNEGTITSPSYTYTRNGNFMLDKEGYLVTAAGQYVLGVKATDTTTGAGLTTIGEDTALTRLKITGKLSDAVDAPSYSDYAIDESGIVTATNTTSGATETLGRLVLSTFNNPAGLDAKGNNCYNVTNNSGEAVVDFVGDKGAGSIQAGKLEMSNVSLASEMTNMIIFQRGFQANSRVITTSDTMLEELVNLKR